MSTDIATDIVSLAAIFYDLLLIKKSFVPIGRMEFFPIANKLSGLRAL
jgi:hypothetical protein